MSAPIGNKFAAKAKEWEQALKRAMARKADGDFRATLDEIAKVDESKAFTALVSDATRAAVTVIDGLRDLAADAKRAHDEGDWG